ncbi:MAG: formylglycine-generating enzyme family protein, partial [Oscillochloris sp.]|nr:formylglycine-generating enzyme family protein [Oscillochloris sp.]
PEDDGSSYVFAHLTMQEHGAGRHLLLQPGAVRAVMERRADDRWREPISLGLGVAQRLHPMLADCIDRIFAELIDPDEGGRPKARVRWYRDLILAAELGNERDWDLLRALINVDRLQRDLKKGLVTLLADPSQPLPTPDRVRAGFLLGDLGDPRFPVTVDDWRCELARAGQPGSYFCRVEPGSYLVGSTDADPDARDNEKPQHTITLDQPLYIARYPITNAQWQAWVDLAKGQSSYAADDANLNRPNQPVVSITWHMANAFCAWLSEQIGVTIRLPSEQEWEAAARGGDAHRYPWGDDWHDDHAASAEDRETRGWQWSVPVGCYPAGVAPCGALDMVGNVWEWTASVWQSYPGAEKAFTDDNRRVLRGGGYSRKRTIVRCGARAWDHPDVRGNDGGFRVVVSPRLAH